MLATAAEAMRTEIEPVMLVEALVLDRGDGLGQVRRHLGERHLDPLLLEDREREAVLVVEHRRRLIHFADAAQRVLVGQAVTQSDEKPDAADRRQRRDQDEDRDDARDDPRMMAPRVDELALQLIHPLTELRTP